MNEITRLEDARILKKMGVPLNTPVEEREFSKAYTEHWVQLMNAHGRFMSAVQEFVDGPRAGSLGKWRLIGRKLVALKKEMQNCDAFLGELSGIKIPGRDVPVFKSEQDQHECALLSCFLTERATLFVEYWEGAIAAVDDGATLTIKPGDIPQWI